MSKKDSDLEWKNRVLCSDEGCIGVIGPDGHCKECGLAYQGELPATFASVSSEVFNAHQSTEAQPDETPEDVEVAQAQDQDQDQVQAQDQDQETATDDADKEWAQRTLCSDESCIGVIGPDGCCKECGKPK